jgi:hypothetical protein
LNDRLDESVVRACQQDDKAAYAVLVKRHYRHVFALCLGVLARLLPFFRLLNDGERIHWRKK